MGTFWQTPIGDEIDQKIDEAIGEALEFYIEETGRINLHFNMEPLVQFHDQDFAFTCTVPLSKVLDDDFYGYRSNPDGPEGKLIALLKSAYAEWKKEFPEGVPSELDDEAA